MRNVYPTNEIAHLWAHQTQQSARNTGGGNFYFSGATIYSYGVHFVCAHIMPHAYARDGAALVLVNSDSYSNTTSKHQSLTRQAIPRYMARLYVAGIREDDVRNIHRYGTQELRTKMVHTFRNAVQESATHRNVFADTRAASLQSARSTLADIRHLATCDAARKDIDTERRKDARKMLRELPETVPTILDGITRKDAREFCEQFAAQVMRGKYREDAARILAIVQCAHSEAIGTLDAPEHTAWEWERRKRRADDAIGRVPELRQAWKLAGMREPRAFAKGLRELQDMAQRIGQAHAQAQRGEWLTHYANERERVRYLVASDAAYVHANDAARYAEQLRATDSETERETRAAEVAELRELVANRNNATAPQRYALTMQVARDAMARGAFSDAERACQTAYRAMPENGEETNALANAIAQARRDDETARLESWRDNAGNNPPSGTFLRLSRNGEAIETSRGANVPVSVCPMIWKAANACRESQTAHEFARGDAPRIGHFTLDRIAENGDIIAGCHEIAFSELQYIATRLGYI